MQKGITTFLPADKTAWRDLQCHDGQLFAATGVRSSRCRKGRKGNDPRFLHLRVFGAQYNLSSKEGIAQMLFDGVCNNEAALHGN